MKPLEISLPGALNRFAYGRVVLVGEVLLDPIYIAYVGAILKAVGAKAMVNKVDFLHLQHINGGYLPDEDGVAGFSVDCDYQNNAVEENNRIFRPQISSDIPLNSMMGSLALTYEMQDRGLVNLYELTNQYADGLCFLTTGNPDLAYPSPDPYFTNVYGDGSVVDDLLHKRNIYWSKKIESIDPEKKCSYQLNSYLASQIFTRVSCIGRSARTHEPLLTNNHLTTEWLNNSGFGRYAGVPIEQQAPIIIDSLKKSADKLSVGDAIDFICNPATGVLIKEVVEQERLAKEKSRKEACEDWLLLVLNLVFGIIPGLGQATTLLSHLYQRKRAGKWY